MNKKLIILGLSLVVIVIGIIMICTLKFNIGLNYGEYTMLNIYMTTESNLEDVKQIVEENFDGKYQAEYIDEFCDTVSIKLKDITEEELTNLQNKIKGKYEFEEDTQSILVINVPAIRIIDLIKDYISPLIISLVIILIYYGIAFRKLGIYESIFKPALTVIIIGALYVSILAICRIPINEYIIPLGIFIYIISVLGVTLCLSNKSKILSADKEK